MDILNILFGMMARGIQIQNNILSYIGIIIVSGMEEFGMVVMYSISGQIFLHILLEMERNMILLLVKCYIDIIRKIMLLH